MGKGKRVLILAALCPVVGLATVPLAGAYTVPGAPGTVGGKPTKPKGGSTTSRNLTAKAAQTISGYTPLELAKRTPSVQFKFPKAGKLTCTLSAGSTQLASGTGKNTKASTAKFKIRFSDRGRSYLRNHKSTAVAVTTKCTFNPNRGDTTTSTSKVVLAA